MAARKPHLSIVPATTEVAPGHPRKGTLPRIDVKREQSYLAADGTTVLFTKPVAPQAHLLKKFPIKKFGTMRFPSRAAIYERSEGMTDVPDGEVAAEAAAQFRYASLAPNRRKAILNSTRVKAVPAELAVAA